MSATLRLVVWVMLLWIALSLINILAVRAQERFGAGAVWVHHAADGNTRKFRNERACWHAHYSQEVLTGSYCEPEKKWVLIEQTALGVSTAGFKSEAGCFLSGVIASHQQGVEAQCRYIGGDVASGLQRPGRTSQ